MRCEEARELIPAYVLGALGTREHDDLEKHLLECLACAAEARQGLETVASMARTLPEHSPSPTLRDVIVRSLPPQGAPEPAYAGPSRWSLLFRQLWLPATAGAFAVMAVALFLNTLSLRSRISALEEQAMALPSMEEKVARSEQLLDGVQKVNVELVNMVQQQRSLVYWLSIPDTQVSVVEPTPGSKGYGMLISRPDSSVAILVISGLPPLPDNQAYHAWLTKGTERSWAGRFEPDPTGWVQAPVSTKGRILDFEGLFVTAGNSPGGPTASNPTILNASLRK